MEDLDIKSFSCDIIVEEKFIPDDEIEDQMEIEVNKVNFAYTLNNIDVDNNDKATINGHKDNSNPSKEPKKSQFMTCHEQHQLYYKCDKCNKRYQTRGHYSIHRKICQIKSQNPNLIICRTFGCQETFTTSTEYEKHKNDRNCVKRSKNEDNGSFKCDVESCTAEFNLYQKLLRHKRDVHIPRKFACLYCDLSFKSKRNKIKHEQVIHFKRSQGHAKKTQKLKKSTESTRYKDKVKSEVEKVEIKQELNDSGRVTRSRNKNINFSSFFEVENDKKSAKNASESDSDDTSTTASFIDSDGEDNNDLKLSKREKLKKNEESDEYLCSVCNESFTTKINVRNHEKNCQNVRIKFRKNKKTIGNEKLHLDCDIHCDYENCTYISTNISKYNQHIDLVHSKFNDKDKSRNETIHQKHRVCFLCRKNLKFKADLDEHMKIPHKIKCPQCSMIFVELAQLDRHIAHVHLQDLKKIQCSKCLKKFKNEIDIKNHTKKVHEKKMKICPICSDELATDKLSRHLETHNDKGAKNKPFCEICQVYLTNKTKLARHFKTKLHLEKDSEKDGSEEFILPHDINSVDSYRLKVKSDEGIFDPSNCTKASRNHVASCQECGLKFRNYFYRDAHREKYHGIKRLELLHCQLCDMNFSRNFCLKNHIKNSVTHKMKEKESQTNKKK